MNNLLPQNITYTESRPISAPKKLKLKRKWANVEQTNSDMVTNMIKDLQQATDKNLNTMRADIQQLQVDLVAEGQHSRKTNLLIYGLSVLPNETSSTLETHILTIINNDVLPEGATKLTAADISDCHRIPSRQEPFPVVVRFVRFKDRNEVFKQRFNLETVNANRKGRHEKPIIIQQHNHSAFDVKKSYLNKIRFQLLENGYNKDRIKINAQKKQPYIVIDNTPYTTDTLPEKYWGDAGKFGTKRPSNRAKPGPTSAGSIVIPASAPATGEPSTSGANP